MRKKIIALLGLILIFFFFLGYGGTFAYLSDVAVKENQVTIGHNDTTIEEEFPSPTPTPMEKNPSYTKKIWVSNKGEGQALVDCFVRVALSYSNSDIGNAVILDGLNTTDWTYSDGFYYYNQILKKGESTSPLITGFHIDSSKIDPKKYEEILKNFEINVYEESVQSEGFTDPQSAFAHYLR